MDAQNFEYRGEGHEQAHPQEGTKPPKKDQKAMRFYMLVFMVAVVILGLYLVYSKYISDSTTAVPTISFLDEKFYGVFLDDGDIYFGKISDKESVFVTVDEAFYLKITQETQTDSNGGIVEVPQLNLVKVGNEIHKPLGNIEIQRSHIVSIQELAPGSEVIKVMKSYK